MTPGSKIYRVCLAMLSVCSLAAQAQPITASPIAPAVKTTTGQVQGTLENGLTVYRGLPFAKSPTGNLRWRAPEPASPWSRVLEATEFKPACMQKGPTLPGMMEKYSEDCLYLNIWTPAKASTDHLPVMVYLYGGGAASGSGSVRLYWGDQLAKRGVIVVTFNYRVGAFGFLAHPDLTKEAGTSGNYGLLDILAALKWVHANIAAFGGDPRNVTLFGQSAGTYWESILMVSPQARGLFHRVIGQSGGEFGTPKNHDSFPSLSEAEKDGVAYVSRFNASSIAEMRQIAADRIVEMDSQLEKAGGVSVHQPNIDGHLIPADVRYLYSQGKQMKIDLLVGSNTDEGINTLGPLENTGEYANDIHRRFGTFADRVLAIYPAGSDAEAKQSQLRMKSDDVAWREYSWARFQADAGVRNVYLYRFSSIPPFGPWPKLHAVGHGAELPYVFGFPPVELLQKYEPADEAALHTAVEDRIQSYWTNFAKTGNPNGSDLPQWPAFRPSSELILDIGDTFTAETLPNKPALDLLDAVHANQ